MDSLSIIIPVYNGERFVSDAIESCIKQKMDIPFEIVVCDDGSTDNSWNIISDYSRKYSVVKVLKHQDNQRLWATRNNCVRNASGNLIFPLDCDNILPEGCIQSLLTHKRGCGLPAVSVEELWYFGQGNGMEITGKWKYVADNGVFDFREMVRNLKCPPSSGNYLYDKKVWEAVNGYPSEAVDLQGSWGFGFFHIAEGYNISITPGTGYYHRYNPDGMYLRVARDHKKMTRLKLQYKKMLSRYIHMLDEPSQRAVRETNDGYALLQGGMLLPKTESEVTK